jgi:tetratricopeptide (TPR) repeat protein
MKLGTILTQRLVLFMTGGILIMGMITFTIIFTSIPTYVSQVEDTLILNEKSNLNVRTNNIAILVTNKFSQTISDIGIVKDYTLSVYNNEFSIKNYYQSYFSIQINGGSIPPGTPCSGICEGISNLRYTTWFNKNQYDPNLNYHLDNTSLLDNVLAPMIQANDAYQFIYLGIENDGFFRISPWQFSDSYTTMNYTCSYNGSDVTGYDPRCRGWYYDSKLNPEQVRFSTPYNDATTDLIMITASTTVNNPSTGDLLGVIGFDLSMTDLDNVILSANILDNGYTYLFDFDAKMVIYPDLSKDEVFSINEIEFSTQQDILDFAPILQRMTSGLEGQESFYKNGQEKWYITYQPITNTSYGIAMVVPYSDVVLSATTMSDTILGLNTGLAVVVIAIAVVMSALGSMAAKSCSENIVSQIKEFNNVTQSITAGKLDVEMGNIEFGSTEFKLIGEKFNMLLNVVRFANSSFFQNNMELAYKNYNNVEQILVELNNERGLGVVYNNKANALTQMESLSNHLAEAEKFFNLAIENALSLLDKAEVESNYKFSETVEFFKITLANRYDNLGHYYFVCGHYDQALEHHDKAIDLHMATDNKLGEMQAYGNKGLIYMEQNRAEEAEKMFMEAYLVATDRYNQNIHENEIGVRKNVELLQYASMNMGLHYAKMKKIDEARQYLNYTLTLTKKIHINVRNQCMMALIDIYDEHFGEEGKIIAEKQKKEMNFGSGAAKNIIFVLDISGSMSGSRIITCRTSIMDIVTNHLGSTDTVSLYTFNNLIEKVFFKLPSTDHDLIRNYVNNRTRTQSRTAFYDAIFNAVSDMNEDVMDNSNQWMVALTDGEDNCSKKSCEFIESLVRVHKVNLIVITVGQLQTEDDIRKIVGASPQGMHIKAEGGTEAISEAFGQAAIVISKGHVNMEVL